MSRIMLALSVSLITFVSTAALANSDNPKCSGPFVCTSSGVHGGSTNTCTPGTAGCNNVTDTKTNPAGNNKTEKCTAPDSQCSK
jgi:hypothetical protein